MSPHIEGRTSPISQRREKKCPLVKRLIRRFVSIGLSRANCIVI
jgi:hypothetical protein